MTFNIIYKEKNGAKAEIRIEAANRSECMSECRRIGIVPVKIEVYGPLGSAPGRLRTNDRAGAEGNAPTANRGGSFGGRSLLGGTGELAGRKKLTARFYLFVSIAAIAAIAWWWLGGRGAIVPPEKAPGKVRIGKTTSPSKLPPKPTVTNVPPPVEAPSLEPPRVDPSMRPTKVGETVNGYIKLPSGRLHKVRGVVTNDFRKATQGKYAIFPHRCENEIACYLSLKPGDAIFGTMKYSGRFKDDFLESLETPIVIEPDDPDDVKELKRNVREAKIQLKEALDRGEDIEQIMLDTRKELQDLARYKMDLTRTIYEMRRDKPMTMEDLQDAVDAANKMLEAKGIAPMKFGPLVRQKMLMAMEQEKEQKQ